MQGKGRLTMGESDNVGVVQAAYAAFGRGDIGAVVDLTAEDVEWEGVRSPLTEGLPFGGLHRGKDGVRRFFAALGENVEFQSFRPKDFIAQGDRVVALGDYEARARKTGRGYRADWAMVFTLRGGKVTRFQEYTDTAAVLAAF
jgi:ketosteroid isomerase-like protein